MLKKIGFLKSLITLQLCAITVEEKQLIDYKNSDITRIIFTVIRKRNI